jgi:hypothetical protein
MNIFFVDREPHIAAQMLCNAHVRSQIKESLQILSTAHYLQGEHTEEMLPVTHKHHPSVKWVAESASNYMWLYQHVVALCTEYKFRHGVSNRYEPMLSTYMVAPEDIDHYSRISCPPAVVAPDLKPNPEIWLHVIEAYRTYYNRDKRHLHYWMVRLKPDWITDAP